MKIAINCCYYGETSGGIREYIYNIVTNLLAIDTANSYIFYVSPDDIGFWKKTMPPQAKYKTFPFKRDQKVQRALLQNRYWKNELSKEKFAIFHSPFFNIPHIEGCKKIMTVHDLRFRRYPLSYTLFRRLYVQFSFRQALKWVDRIITVSDFTKNEITALYRYNSDHIMPIHEAVDSNRFREIKNDTALLKKTGLESQKYLLTVGHLEPRKNYPSLIKAVELLNQDPEYQYKLVIVGKKNYKYKETVTAISQSSSTIYLDFVDHETLMALYKNALVFVFPSIYEGFGFPPLEAAQFGVPSAVSNVSSIPEICGEGAVYFDPLSTEEMVSAIKQVIKLRADYSLKAAENLKRFSWKSAAEKTIALYEELTGNGKS